MPYALEPLLDIRVMREDRASAALTAARQAAAAAADAVDARKAELEKFEASKDERRDRIYDTILGRPVNRDQIDLALEGVARIDQEGAIRLDNVRQAENELKKKEEAVETARAGFFEATKNRMKIGEHKAVWQEIEAKEAEAQSDMELEDFTARKLEI